MADLAEWLLAQIAEDEACADLCARCGHSPLDHLDTDPGRRECVRPPGCICPDFQPAGVFNPDYVKALCVARRRIVELHEGTIGGGCTECVDQETVRSSCGLDAAEWPCQTLRLLALPHAGHDGYLEEWRPD